MEWIRFILSVLFYSIIKRGLIKIMHRYNRVFTDMKMNHPFMIDFKSPISNYIIYRKKINHFSFHFGKNRFNIGMKFYF